MTATVPWLRGFLIYWLGQFAALTGLGLAMFSIGVYTYRLYESPVALGLALALSIAPFVVASPVAGALVDRWGPKRALVVSNALGMVNVLVFTVLFTVDLLADWRVLIFLWLAAAFKAMHLAAFETAIPLIVPKRHLGRVNGTRMFLTAASAVLGPVLAGPLLGTAGVYGVVVTSCITFVLALVSLRTTTIPEIGRSTDDGLLRGFWRVWRHIAARRGLLALLGCLAAVNVGIGGAELLFSQLTLSFATQESLQAILLAGAAGLTAMTVAMVFWGGPKRLAAGFLWFSVLLGAAMVVGALRPSVPLLAVAAFVFLGGTPVVLGTAQTIWHLKVEPEFLGRASALKNLFVDFPYALTQLLLGVATSLVFVPLVGDREVGSTFVAALVGDGPGRGFAFAMMAIGVMIAACVALAYRFSGLSSVERSLPDVAYADPERRLLAGDVR